MNWGTRFVCDIVNLESGDLPQSINLPIAHGEGRYVIPDEGIKDLNQLLFLKYRNNPNGSMLDIAGLYDRDKKIIGMMPHPERAVFKETGHTDGRYVFELIEAELV